MKDDLDVKRFEVKLSFQDQVHLRKKVNLRGSFKSSMERFNQY
jgi:hypothetical protein